MADSGSVATNPSGRMACAFCRKRKLKCDRRLPKCESCQKYGFECEYGPPKSHTRRDQRSSQNSSHVRRLEDRLRRLELLLQQTRIQQHTQDGMDILSSQAPGFDAPKTDGDNRLLDPAVLRELEHVYFKFIHPSANMIHPARYIKSLGSGADLQPPTYLRHIMCALAAPASEAHASLREPFYQSARKRLQEAELGGQHIDKLRLPLAQTAILIAIYELKHAHLPRSLISISQAVRLVQMMRLHRIDGINHITDPGLNLMAGPTDWAETEERRRTFWTTFLVDRYASIGFGWPTLINEKDIRSYLPVSDEAYENSIEERSIFLSDAMVATENHKLSAFAAQVVIVSLSASNLQDLLRFDPDTHSADSIGSIWFESSRLSNALATMFRVPQHLSIPTAKLDPTIVFLNMGAAASTICVHRFAKFQAGGDVVAGEVMQQSKIKCLEAASTILQLMKMTSHWDLNSFHPCTSFCLCTAALTYAESFTTSPDTENESALRFLVNSLRNFTKTVRFTDNLIGDIETEFSGLLAQLDGENTDSVSNEFFKFDFTDDIYGHLATDTGQFDQDFGVVNVNGTMTPDFSPHEAATGWTVDDPDIASVARYL